MVELTTTAATNLYHYENASNQSASSIVILGPSNGMTIFGLVMAVTVTLLGIFGNSITIIAYQRNRKLQTSYNHLITNLCFVDLIFSILVMPFKIPLIVFTHEIYPRQLCIAIGYVYSSLSSSSVINLVFIGINRYVGIVHSARYRYTFSKGRIKKWVIAVWLTTPFIYLPFLFSNFFLLSEYMRCDLSNEFEETSIQVYHIAVNTVLKLLPAVVLIILYRAILEKVKNCRKTVEHHPAHDLRTPSWKANENSRMSCANRRLSTRQNSVKSNQEANIQPKPLNSPSDSKQAIMTYLQVPTHKASLKMLPKTSSFSLDRDWKLSRSNGNLSICSEIVKVAQSSPELFSGNEADGDTRPDNIILIDARRCSWNGKRSPQCTTDQKEHFAEYEESSLATSERPRNKLIIAMRRLQIMSTIDSETNSRTISVDQPDDIADDGVFTKASNKSDLNSTPEGRETTEVQADQKEIKKRVEHIETNNLQFDASPEIKAKLFKEMLISPTESKLENLSTPSPFKCQSSITSEVSVHRNKGHTELEEKISNNASHNNGFGNKLFIPSNQSDLKKIPRSNWKDINDNRKSFIYFQYAKTKPMLLSTSSERKRNSPKRLKLNRTKSEGYNSTRTSWKRRWSRKKESPNIKIIIDKAMSDDVPEENLYEDSNKDSSALNNNKSYSRQRLNNLAEKFDERVICKLTEKNDKQKILSSQHFLQKIFFKRVASNSSQLRDDNTNKSLETVPSQSTTGQETSVTVKSLSGKQLETQERVNSVESSCENTIFKCTEWLKDSEGSGLQCEELSKSQILVSQNGTITSDIIADSNDWITSDERRSSATHHRLYRYSPGSDEGLTRQESFSCASFTSDYTRRGNQLRSPILKNAFASADRKSLNSFLAGSSASNIAGKHRQKRRRDTENHLARCGFAICVAFAICVLPQFVIDILDNQSITVVTSDIRMLVAMFSWIHAVINPLFYGFLNPQYRLEFQRIKRDARRWFRINNSRRDRIEADSQFNSTAGWSSKAFYAASWWEKRSSKRQSAGL